MIKLYKLYNLHRCSAIFAFISALFMLTSSVQAEDVYIQLNVQQCDVTLSNENGNGCDNQQCSGDVACVCVSKGDHISWLIAGSEAFKLKFSGDSPLKDNCGKNFKKKKQKCVVKEDAPNGQTYDYEIYLKSCNEGTDPRIIIKS